MRFLILFYRIHTMTIRVYLLVLFFPLCIANVMNGVYVNEENIVLALFCYRNHSFEGESVFVISGTIFDAMNRGDKPVSVIGWTDSCLRNNGFALTLQNQTEFGKTMWFVQWTSTSIILVQPKKN